METVGVESDMKGDNRANMFGGRYEQIGMKWCTCLEKSKDGEHDEVL